jgi:hypothetical protein
MPQELSYTSTVPCGSCGNEILARVRFCRWCGTEQGTQKVAAQVTKALTKSTRELTEKREDVIVFDTTLDTLFEKRSRHIFVITGIVGLSLITALLFYAQQDGTIKTGQIAVIPESRAEVSLEKKTLPPEIITATPKREEPDLESRNALFTTAAKEKKTDLAPSSLPLTGSGEWHGKVIGSAVIELKGRTLTIVGPPASIESGHLHISESLPDSPSIVQVEKRTGTGDVVVIQQPGSANNYTARILITNPPENDIEDYLLKITWETSPN